MFLFHPSFGLMHRKQSSLNMEIDSMIAFSKVLLYLTFMLRSLERTVIAYSKQRCPPIGQSPLHLPLLPSNPPPLQRRHQ
jgi:hypothetical protein